MKELAQVRRAVIDALNAGGVTAMEAFPADRAKRWPGAVAAVAVGAAEGKMLGFCNYLGEIVNIITFLQPNVKKQSKNIIFYLIYFAAIFICDKCLTRV